jgi:hypothetical protein
VLRTVPQCIFGKCVVGTAWGHFELNLKYIRCLLSNVRGQSQFHLFRSIDFILFYGARVVWTVLKQMAHVRSQSPVSPIELQPLPAAPQRTSTTQTHNAPVASKYTEVLDEAE